MQELHALRREMLVLKGVLWPLRDALAALIRNDDPFVTRETKVFLNDTLDHAMRLIELVESQRDTLSGLIEMHLSLSQARTNDVISLLTIVSTIFIPLTFLVGYPAALLFMIAVAIALFGYFKWRKWL
jgi:magnesium transporter